MAIYHCSVKTISRSLGHSAVAAAAYRNGLKLVDERTGEVHDYTKRKGVDFTEIITPPEFPEVAKSSQLLWNKAEEAETRKNSTVAREFEIALPHELDRTRRIELSRKLAQKLVDRFGFAVEFSIHQPDKGEGLNHHVHILATTRKLGKDGFSEKTRELDQKTSGAVEEVRSLVADIINGELAAAGQHQKVDHRSLAAQRDEAIENGDYVKAVELSREPTRHIGKNPGTAPGNWSYNNRVKTEHKANLETISQQLEAITVSPPPPKVQPVQPAEPTQPFFLKLMNQSKAGLIWFITQDWFGIEAREKKQQAEARQQLRRQEKERRKEEQWRQAVSALNQGREQEERFRRSLGPLPDPKPNPEQAPAPRGKPGMKL